MDAREVYKAMTGKTVTTEEIQRLMATASAMGIKTTDAAFLQLIVQDANFGLLHKLPERLKRKFNCLLVKLLP